MEWVPYVTLAIGLVLSPFQRQIPGLDRLVSIGLATAAAAWVLFMFTLQRDRRKDQRWMRLYFGGLMVFSAVFMYLLPVYFVFVITGFIHAYLLKPAPYSLSSGSALTSLIINSRIIYPDPTADGWWTYGIIS